MALTNIIRLSTTDSTNNYLKNLLLKQSVEEFTVITTAEQQLGRGFGANTWESEPGKNITLSMLFKPTFIEATSLFSFNMCIALAVADMIRSFVSLVPVTVKWPNDVYIGDKKVAGILIENTFENNIIAYSIVGIGLNVNQTIFKSDAPNPTSLCTISKKEIDLEVALQTLLKAIQERYYQLQHDGQETIRIAYHNHLYMYELKTKFKKGDETFEGRILGVTPDGKLRVLIQHEEVTFEFKEIEFILT